jgi:hypothetical protein
MWSLESAAPVPPEDHEKFKFMDRTQAKGTRFFVDRAPAVSMILMLCMVWEALSWLLPRAVSILFQVIKSGTGSCIYYSCLCIVLTHFFFFLLGKTLERNSLNFICNYYIQEHSNLFKTFFRSFIKIFKYLYKANGIIVNMPMYIFLVPSLCSTLLIPMLHSISIQSRCLQLNQT